MSYPQGAPGGPGYPPAQQPTAQFSAPTQQFSKVPEQAQAAEGGSKLPMYLSAAVAVLGLLVYLSGFGPQFTITASDFPGLGQLSGSSLGLLFAVIASVVSGLVAGLGLLPKQRSYVALAAVAAVLAFMLVLAEVVKKPSGASIGWGLYLVIAFTLLQAAVAVVTLLFDAGIITAPAPRPKYDQSQHFGQYPGHYYGQPHGQPQHGPGAPQQQGRPGYPTPVWRLPRNGSVDRRVPRPAAIGAAHAAHRLSDLRSAAVGQLADDPGTPATPAVFLAVGSVVVVV